MRSRLLGATGWALVVMVAAGTASACSDDDEAQTGATLPPIVTVPTTASTTLAPSTTLPMYYEIQRGDTLTRIAAAYNLPVQVIMDFNGITNPDAIQAGQILQLPDPAQVLANSLPGGATTSVPVPTTVAP